MNLLRVAEIREGLAIPDFGEALRKHILEKKHPRVLGESLAAWNLLADMLTDCGQPMPQVDFLENGKPIFVGSPLHFSLSHSGRLVAVLLSDAPCGADIQIMDKPISDALIRRVLNERERSEGADFFDVWTLKECLGKLSGDGLRILEEKSVDFAAYSRLLTDVSDSDGKKYRLAALCANRADIIRDF